MTPGTVIADSDLRHFVVLDGAHGRYAVAPILIGRNRGDKRYGGDVAVSLPMLGTVIVSCARATVASFRASNTGMILADAELRACQIAAKRATNERWQAFAPSPIFAAACPSFRSGGRRVGTKPTA